MKGAVALNAQVDVDIDRYFGGCLRGLSKSIQVLFNGNRHGTHVDNAEITGPVNVDGIHFPDDGP